MVFYFLIAAILGVWILYSYYGAQMSPDQIQYSTFRAELRDNNVKEVVVQGDRIEGELKSASKRRTVEGDTISFTEFVTYLPSFGDDELMALLEESNANVTTIPERDSTWIYFLFMTLPFLLILIIAIAW